MPLPTTRRKLDSKISRALGSCHRLTNFLEACSSSNCNPQTSTVRRSPEFGGFGVPLNSGAKRRRVNSERLLLSRVWLVRLKIVYDKSCSRQRSWRSDQRQQAGRPPGRTRRTRPTGRTLRDRTKPSTTEKVVSVRSARGID